MTAADLGDDELAEQYARESIKQADDLNQVVMQCKSRLALIYLNIKNKDWEGALKLCNEGKELYLPTENLFAKSEIQIITPLVLLGSGQLTEANAAVDEVLELVTKHQRYHYQGIALRMKGQILTAQGETDEAADKFHQAIEVLSGLSSQLELGRVYFHRGQLLKIQNKMEQSIEDIKTAMHIFKECSAIDDLKLAQDSLASPN
jgi:tetratricopeptide (TPR) repeat protein